MPRASARAPAPQLPYRSGQRARCDAACPGAPRSVSSGQMEATRMTEGAHAVEELVLGDPASPVGLCTLWTRQERILRGVPRELYAVCGNLYSLWGISLLIRGVLARPTLRYLVVCGVDYADTGRALVALAAQGLASDGTLPGTAARLADDIDALPPPPPLGAAPAAVIVPAGWTPPPLTPPGAAEPPPRSPGSG